MRLVLLGPFLVVVLSVAILVAIESGRRLGKRRIALDPEGAKAGLGAVQAAVFGLLGLLIAFTFSGAASRFDHRRDLITEETNAIGTAWLRIDIVPEASRPALRDLFRRYLDARLEIYEKLPDIDAAYAALDRSLEVQAELWQTAVEATRTTGPAGNLVLSAINEMFDMATTRTVATQLHPPPVIFGMLVILILAGSVLVGYETAESRTRSLVHIIGFAVAMSVVVFVIVNLEFPRLGMIRIESFDKILIDLRQSMQ